MPRPRKRLQVVVERVVAPKKRWVDTKPTVAPTAPTQVDFTPDAPTATPTEDKERSPRRQRSGQKGKGQWLVTN